MGDHQSVPTLFSYNRNHLFISPLLSAAYSGAQAVHCTTPGRAISPCRWHSLELCSAQPVQLCNLAGL